MILLTDEENPYPNPETTVLTEKHLLRAMEAPMSNYEIFKAGAEAQLKKVVEWLDTLEFYDDRGGE